MKLIRKIDVKKMIILFLSTILFVASMFFGVQIKRASADEGNTIQLSIYSSYGDDSSSSNNIGLGHAWLVVENGTSYTYDFYNTIILPGETFTIGTWGNREDPDTNKTHKGAWLNLEAYYGMWDRSTASLTMTITAEQLETVSEKCISMNEWTAINNCSYFASKVWNAVAPSNLDVSSYFFPANFPSTLKKSIKKRAGYQTNRPFAYNDYTGYCINDTTFKYIEASSIDKGSSSSASSRSNDVQNIDIKNYYTSFPEEFNTVEKIRNAYKRGQI